MHEIGRSYFYQCRNLINMTYVNVSSTLVKVKLNICEGWLIVLSRLYSIYVKLKYDICQCCICF